MIEARIALANSSVKHELSVSAERTVQYPDCLPDCYALAARSIDDAEPLARIGNSRHQFGSILALNPVASLIARTPEDRRCRFCGIQLGACIPQKLFREPWSIDRKKAD